MRVAILCVVIGFMGCQRAEPSPSSEDEPAVVPDAGQHCEECEVIRHVRVVDADGERLDRRVVLKGDRIVVEEADDDGALNARDLDASGKSLVPGLWDLHVHLMSSPGASQQQAFTASHLRSLLRSGVTHALDLGTPRSLVFSIRSQLRRDDIRGPELLAAGAILTVPGGHPCSEQAVEEMCTMSLADGGFVPPLPDIAAEQPDVLKVAIEGGIPGEPLPRIGQDALRRIAQLGQMQALPVIAHVSRAQDVRDALDAGIRNFAHLPAFDLLEPADVQALRAAEASFITTVAVYEALPRLADEPSLLQSPDIAQVISPEILSSLSDQSLHSWMSSPEGQAHVERFRLWTANAVENLRRLNAAGVTILAGSDSGNLATFHGPGLLRELELLVSAGLTHVQAIASATSGPSRMFGREADLGRVKAGFVADLLLVEGNPAADIRALARPLYVFHKGERLTPDALAATVPPSSLFKRATPAGEGAFCVDSAQCDSGRTCSAFDDRCRLPCTLNGMACPTGSACLSSDARRAHCFPGEGCDARAQDCPYPEAYSRTCVPYLNGYTYCQVDGTRAQGESCSFEAPCGHGLYCGLGDVCYRLCDPASTSPLPACLPEQSCLDLSSQWQSPVGLCVGHQ